MKKKVSILLTMVVLSVFAFTGCAKPASTATEGVPMQYMERGQLKEMIISGEKDYVILDVRKNDDYQDGHIVEAISADLDKAKEGDHESGIANLTAALKTASDNGVNKEQTNYILLCYSGKSYAQKGTDLLTSMGIDSKNIYTLNGGYKGWTENDADGEYDKLLVSGEQSGTFSE